MLRELEKVESETAGCTIIAKNYLAMARVLAESFARHNPGSNFFVLLMDPVEGCFNPAQEQFHLVETRHLPIPDLEKVLFKYDVLEASTAVKPYFMEYLLERHNIRKLVYLDPDVLVLSTFDGIWRALEESAIVLTPHITRQYPDQAHPNERDLVVAGSYNLGFIGVRRCETTDQFLRWWQRMVYNNCVSFPERGLFVDQKFVNLVPGLYGDVRILREAKYNVAYWNLHERQITMENDEVLVEGGACCFFHFSGFDPAEPAEISKHQTRYKMSELGEGRELFRRYRSLLLKHGWKQSARWAYTYDYFDNGERIPKSARRYYWSLGDELREFSDPFSWLGAPERSGRTAGGLVEAPFENDRAEDCDGEAADNLPFGVNVAGYVTSEKGVGESIRSNLRILQAAGIRCIANNFVDPDSRNLERPPKNLSSSNPYRINLINVNADQTPFFARSNKNYLRGRHNIGYWAWELSEFPEQWHASFEYLDEVWVPSTFVHDCLSAVAPVPVLCVHHSIDPDLQFSTSWADAGRARLRLRSDQFIFLFLFDFQSYMERKNPLGLIRAFKQAFGDRKDVALVIKSARGACDMQSYETLQRTVEAEGRTANIRLLDEVLPREMIRSLMWTADCYVSLHRSEGFGLTLAEAMQQGKPVIATGYSGNMDFMTEENSFLVRYRLKEIEQTYGPYRAGWVWADPDLEHAAELMRHVFENRETAARVGERARHDVMHTLHPEVLGRVVKARLEVLEREQRALASR